MKVAPRAEPLAVPREYGSPSKLLAWNVVETRLAEARRYWLATVRPDGHPHVVPLDGLWVDCCWYFGGSSETVRHRNLLSNPYATLHLEDADSAVIVEGRCEVIVPSREAAEHLAATSRSKYGHAPPVSAYRKGVWTLWPLRAMAWTRVDHDATRFLFS